MLNLGGKIPRAAPGRIAEERVIAALPRPCQPLHGFEKATGA
jgi:hypothetical protein